MTLLDDVSMYLYLPGFESAISCIQTMHFSRKTARSSNERCTDRSIVSILNTFNDVYNRPDAERLPDQCIHRRIAGTIRKINDKAQNGCLLSLGCVLTRRQHS